MNLAYHAFNISAPATLNKCSRTLSDAQPQRCPGRAEESDPQCTLTLCRAAQQAHQDRYTFFGQELHPDAGQRAGGDEEAGVLLVPRGRGADPLPPCHRPCPLATCSSERTWPWQPWRPSGHVSSPPVPIGVPPTLLLAVLLHLALHLALAHTSYQQVASRHIIRQEGKERSVQTQECF